MASIVGREVDRLDEPVVDGARLEVLRRGGNAFGQRMISGMCRPSS